MQNRLKNQWVLITGVTSGIGKTAAIQFADLECNFVITGRRETRLQQLRASLKDYPIEVLLSSFGIRDRKEYKKFTDSLTVDVYILVNNAGLAKGIGHIYDADIDYWEQMIDTNVKGLLYITRFISEKMKIKK